MGALATVRSAALALAAGKAPTTFRPRPRATQAGVLLLVHGEVTDPDVDFFDREKVFIESKLRPLLDEVRRLGWSACAAPARHMQQSAARLLGTRHALPL